MCLTGRNRKRINSLSSIGWNMCLARIPGARDLSRRNTATADRRLELSRPLRFPAFLRTEVRAPFARSDRAKQVPDGGEGEKRCTRMPLSSVLSPLLRRGERKKKRALKNRRAGTILL